MRHAHDTQGLLFVFCNPQALLAAYLHACDGRGQIQLVQNRGPDLWENTCERAWLGQA